MGTSVRFRFFAVVLVFSSKVVVCGHCLVILSLTVNETLNGSYRCPSLLDAGVILVVTAV